MHAYWYVALFARRLAFNHYAIAPTYDAANAHVQSYMIVTRHIEAKKVTLLSKAFSFKFIETKARGKVHFRSLKGLLFKSVCPVGIRYTCCSSVSCTEL